MSKFNEAGFLLFLTVPYPDFFIPCANSIILFFSETVINPRSTHIYRCLSVYLSKSHEMSLNLTKYHENS